MPNKLKPICLKCRREMIVEKVGVYVAPKGGGNFYSGDTFQCSKCGYRVITDFGNPQDLRTKEEIGPPVVVID